LISCDYHVCVYCTAAVDIDHCNFEHQSFCGWTQDSEDYPDWEINSRETDTKRTGPTFDHTFGPDLKSGKLWTIPKYINFAIVIPVWKWLSYCNLINKLMILLNLEIVLTGRGQTKNKQFYHTIILSHLMYYFRT
jgi:hypothetical protein